MYFTDPKAQADFDARYSTTMGVMLEDKKSKLLLREIRQALREGKILFLRKKKKFNLTTPTTKA